MHLISLALDPAFHALIIIICLLAGTALAQTSPYTCQAGQVPVSELANIGMSCSTLSYGSLTGSPTIPVVQAYENTIQRLNPIVINKTAAVAGGAGNATFNITTDGTSGGTAICPNGVMLNSPNLSVNDATAPYQFSWAWSNANKTVTVLTQKASGLAVLTFTLLGIPAPVANGTNINATVICY